MLGSVLTSWLHSLNPSFLFPWCFMEMELIKFSSSMLHYLPISYGELNCHQNIMHAGLSFFVCVLKRYVSFETACLGYNVTPYVIPVRLQWAQVMDIVINDIWFIRICQNGLVNYGPWKEHNTALYWENTLWRHSWAGLYYNLPRHFHFLCFIRFTVCM